MDTGTVEVSLGVGGGGTGVRLVCARFMVCLWQMRAPCRIGAGRAVFDRWRMPPITSGVCTRTAPTPARRWIMGAGEANNHTA